MLLGTNNNPANTQDEERSEDMMDLSVHLLDQGRYEEAWAVLNGIKTDSIESTYNKALCMFHVKEYETSLRYAQSALDLIKPQAVPGKGLRAPESPELKTIRRCQYQSEDYLKPVSSLYTKLFPYILIDSVRRLMIDCYSATGNNAKVVELGTPLKNKGYANVDKALEKADKNAG